jgi:undecaprenyl diphosphate synthase
VAVIPDGNRRWARARGLDPVEGHPVGIANVGRIAAAAWDAGVETFTFWWGSTANLTLRPEREIDVIVTCLAEWLAGDGAALLRDYDASFSILGRWPAICPSLAPAIDRASDNAGAGPRRLVVLMAYDGREEIVDAAARLAAEASPPGADDLDRFGEAMWTRSLPDVDLLIRTGGEPHLSAGFLLWRIANAQLAFEDCMWPAFTPQELVALLDRHAAVERRFGR